MARNIRSGQLETRSSRLRLAARRKPYTARIGPGLRLGYRRNATAGTWSVLAADGKGGSWLKGFAAADDYEDANADTVLDFWQAQDRARVLARRASGTEVVEDKPVTVSEALDRYRADLETRNGDVGNVGRLLGHLSNSLTAKPVALLTSRELRRWRDGLKKTLTAGTINRLANALRAALNLAADTDERIVSRRAWEVGLQSIPDAVVSRNVIIPTETIRRIVTAAYALDESFGLLVEMAATTGSRVSQIMGLQCQDLQADRLDPRVLMPSSKKGGGQKKISRRPVPIPAALAIKLRHAAKGRSAAAPLLMRTSGEPWRKSNHARLFRSAVESCALDPAVATIAALRHSNITRQLIAGVPIRVVAVNHDTSVAMIEKTYSKHIGDHADALARPALLDLSQPAAVDNVVPLVR
jgi:integrase